MSTIRRIKILSGSVYSAAVVAAIAFGSAPAEGAIVSFMTPTGATVGGEELIWGCVSMDHCVLNGAASGAPFRYPARGVVRVRFHANEDYSPGAAIGQ